jgi:hypothetical protein
MTSSSARDWIARFIRIIHKSGEIGKSMTSGVGRTKA